MLERGLIMSLYRSFLPACIPSCNLCYINAPNLPLVSPGILASYLKPGPCCRRPVCRPQVLTFPKLFGAVYNLLPPKYSLIWYSLRLWFVRTPWVAQQLQGYTLPAIGYFRNSALMTYLVKNQPNTTKLLKDKLNHFQLDISSWCRINVDKS